MQHCTRSKVQGFILLEKHTGDDTGNGMEETVEQRAVVKKKVPKIFINGKDTMFVSNIEQFKGYRGSTPHGIEIAAGRAETTAAAKRSKFKLAAAGASIHGSTKRGITAVVHFINIFNDGISGM